MGPSSSKTSKKGAATSSTGAAYACRRCVDKNPIIPFCVTTLVYQKRKDLSNGCIMDLIVPKVSLFRPTRQTS